MHIPIVASSAKEMPQDIEKTPNARSFRYLTKPVRINQYLNTLDLSLEFAEKATGQPG